MDAMCKSHPQSQRRPCRRRRRHRPRPRPRPRPPRRNPHDIAHPPRHFLLARFGIRNGHLSSTPLRLVCPPHQGPAAVPMGWYAMCPCIRMIVGMSQTFFFFFWEGVTRPIAACQQLASSHPLPCFCRDAPYHEEARRMRGQAGRRELREARSTGGGGTTVLVRNVVAVKSFPNRSVSFVSVGGCSVCSDLPGPRDRPNELGDSQSGHLIIP
ncbi:hypothetical protein LY76DRAFT_364148 [Colletotrichum caudatum]|nr:hypothetical protein LY76DRAFT_364148 [Colletotrichum caudatum]